MSRYAQTLESMPHVGILWEYNKGVLGSRWAWKIKFCPPTKNSPPGLIQMLHAMPEHQLQQPQHLGKTRGGIFMFQAPLSLGLLLYSLGISLGRNY